MENRAVVGSDRAQLTLDMTAVTVKSPVRARENGSRYESVPEGRTVSETPPAKSDSGDEVSGVEPS